MIMMHLVVAPKNHLDRYHFEEHSPWLLKPPLMAYQTSFGTNQQAAVIRGYTI